MIKRCIKEGKQDCYTKSHLWLNDEKIQLAIYKCIFLSGDKLSAQKLVKVVGDYLGSQRITNIV